MTETLGRISLSREAYGIHPSWFAAEVEV